MPKELITFLLFIAALGFAVAFLFTQKQLNKCISSTETSIRKAREDSVKRSKAIVRASVSEEMVPLLEGFPYQIGDLRLFSKPVDFVVFDGMNEFRDGNKDKEITIILADVKTGKAVKTPVQKAIMQAIESGRIRFEEWRIDEQNKFSIK